MASGTMHWSLERVPLAYLITFTVYGARLHGSVKGSVDRRNNMPGTAGVLFNVWRERREQDSMRQGPYLLDGPRRRIVLRAILAVCAERPWLNHATHVRTNHVHVVVDAIADPAQMATAFKARASRLLNEAGIDAPDRRRWARGSSRRCLWTEAARDAAIRYVVFDQGEPMSLHCRDDLA